MLYSKQNSVMFCSVYKQLECPNSALDGYLIHNFLSFVVFWNKESGPVPDDCP